MTVSEQSWKAYVERLRKVSDEAADKFKEYYLRVGDPLSEAGRKALSWEAFVIGRDYGEAAAELACEMYDSMVAAEGMEMGRPAGWIEPAVPADTATYSEAAKTVNGVLKTSVNPDEMAGAVSRLVKMAGVDTILSNAYRDRPRSKGKKHTHSGAQVAWIPHGDTCPFCIMLASNGWQYQSLWAQGSHAEHVHSNCDCTYGVRFSDGTNFEGYDPEKYLEQYRAGANAKYENEADSHPEKKQTQSQKNLNGMYRNYYKENRDKINAQKREAYRLRQEAKKEGVIPSNT